jgi:2-polyprenyl-3-methyl-5-hydroxy-6-metoxy-1,4-benzoquinol methylase
MTKSKLVEQQKFSIRHLAKLHKELYGFDDPYLVERVFQCISSAVPYLLGKQDLNVADFGCGDLRATGLVNSQLPFKIQSFYCVDLYSKPRIDFEKLTVINRDLNQPNPEIANDSLDFAYSLEVIEHLWNCDAFISDIHRVLKSQGLLLLTTPNFAAWYNRFLVPFGILPIHYEVSFKQKYGRKFKSLGEGGNPVGHIRLFTPVALSRLLEDNGFEILDCKGLQFIYEGLGSSFDKIFAKFPSMSSMFLILAKKK